MVIKTDYLTVARSRLAYISKQSIVSHKPKIMQIESTNHCNLKCPMCPQPTMKRPKGFMDFDFFKKVIDENRMYLEEVGLHHFGEALIHPRIVDMIAYTNERDVFAGFSTNGALLKKDLSTALIKAGIHWINLDFDSFDKMVFEKVRVNAKFEQVLKNINDFIEEKERLNSSVEITIQMIKFDDNKPEFTRFLKEWRRKGVNHVRLQSYLTYDKDIKSVTSLVKDPSIKANGHKMCFYPWRSLVILWDGRVVPCCGDYEAKNVLGSLQDSTIEEMWNGEKMVALRDDHIRNNFENNELCRNCLSFNTKWPFK